MEERMGVNSVDSSNVSSEVMEFNNFVDNIELVDLPLLGRRFT
jgi:hypothetical protein